MRPPHIRMWSTIYLSASLPLLPLESYSIVSEVKMERME